MKSFISILRKSKLFSGISEEEIESMLSCLGARISYYKKGAYILTQGAHLAQIPVLVKGSVHIQRDDYWGNRSILGHIVPGEMFAESYVSLFGETLANDVIATEDSAVIFFNVERILTTCPASCSFHNTVIRNLFFAISEKNRKLVQKVGHMSMRSTREKLISYLSEEANHHKSSSFSIPFNRQELADFLSVDRSAMSNELCKMRDDGLLKFHKNNFELLSSDTITDI